MAVKKNEPMPVNVPYVDPWRAKDDAQMLMRAEEIKNDRTRLGPAQKEAARIATAAQAAAAKPAPKPQAPKAPAKPAPVQRKK